MAKQQISEFISVDLIEVVDRLHGGGNIADLIEAAEHHHQAGVHHALCMYAASCLDRGQPLSAQLQAFVVRVLRAR